MKATLVWITTFALLACSLASQPSCSSSSGSCSNMGNLGGGCWGGVSPAPQLEVTWVNQTVLSDTITLSVPNAPASGINWPWASFPYIIYIAAFSPLSPVGGVPLASCNCSLFPALEYVYASVLYAPTFFVPQSLDGTIFVQAAVLAPQGSCSELTGLGQMMGLTDAWVVSF